MEEQYTIAEAKNKLPSIVHSVAKGVPVRLTRHGRPVAVLLSVGRYEKLTRGIEGYWKALESLRNQMKIEDVQISDADFEDLRDASPGRKMNLA
ncbi:MAG: type II toxin-antitoxin system prevent-host-death family antitoxin [Syntrophobacteraceae bacterium]|nr:type II toxin-antitoxin system prevent-host-death family antitoxin [Syntrophobacteraceae bacterium]